MLRFRLRTLVIAIVFAASIAAIWRRDWFSVLAGVAFLFALLTFAEDIWPWLPR